MLAAERPERLAIAQARGNQFCKSGEIEKACGVRGKVEA